MLLEERSMRRKLSEAEKLETFYIIFLILYCCMRFMELVILLLGLFSITSSSLFLLPYLSMVLFLSILYYLRYSVSLSGQTTHRKWTFFSSVLFQFSLSDFLFHSLVWFLFHPLRYASLMGRLILPLTILTDLSRFYYEYTLKPPLITLPI